MLNSNSKLLPARNPFVVLLTILVPFLLLVNNAKSESFSLDFPLDPNDGSISTARGTSASLKDGLLQLTSKDENGNPVNHTAGLAVYFKLIPLYDASSGKVADFTTDFSFSVNRRGSNFHGDGMSFFIASPLYDWPNPRNSYGGFLGLFRPETAFTPTVYRDKVVAVEFDSFANEWDPNPLSQYPHIGINVNSIKSESTVAWPSDSEPDGFIADAHISYESATRTLSVLVTYPNSDVPGEATLTYNIDLTTVLPDLVRIGFTAATGNFVETHDILSWSFTSSL